MIVHVCQAVLVVVDAVTALKEVSLTRRQNDRAATPTHALVRVRAIGIRSALGA
jgi:hypothetical protein